MLRLAEDGSISLTIKGVTLATLDRTAASEFTAAALVAWENLVRAQYYERTNGFFSKWNQQESRRAETSEARLRHYPLARVQKLDDFNDHWEKRRDEAIDN